MDIGQMTVKRLTSPEKHQPVTVGLHENFFIVSFSFQELHGCGSWCTYTFSILAAKDLKL